MKRIIALILILASMSLLGCNQQLNEKDNLTLELDGKIKEINIFKSNGFDKSNSDLIVTVTNEETIYNLRNIITSATKLDGIVDIREPDFNLDIIYKDNSKEKFYIWLEKNGGKGALMNSEDTNTLYNISEEMNDEWIDFIEVNKNG
ncbi:MAG: hypothetical protein ACTHVE_06365 [Senegalia sp. (in: firmicutes)]|uniref:hypothetical protein n=1 Tax=Senegalia sp. (in: firmicutes) TaxID=1924098 RepID=UPI003F97F8B0